MANAITLPNVALRDCDPDLLCKNKMAPRNVMPSLFIAQGVSSVPHSSVCFLFVLRYFLGVQAVADVVFHDVYGLAVGAREIIFAILAFFTISTKLLLKFHYSTLQN